MSNDREYKKTINNVLNDINDTQLSIMVNANINIVNLYYRIGKVLYDNSKWGNKFIDVLAFEIKYRYPNQKGYSIRNLKYMKQFYSEYKDRKEIVHLCAQLPWKEYGSKLGFYLQALDEQIKDSTDNPSIGIILCPSKNNEVVDYTLKYINKPLGISEYRIYDKLSPIIMDNFPDNKDISNLLL